MDHRRLVSDALDTLVGAVRDAVENPQEIPAQPSKQLRQNRIQRAAATSKPRFIRTVWRKFMDSLAAKIAPLVLFVIVAVLFLIIGLVTGNGNFFEFIEQLLF